MERKGKRRGKRERRAARRSQAIKELFPSLGASVLVGRPPQLSTEHAHLGAPIDPRDAAAFSHTESVVLGVVKDARCARAAGGGGLHPSLTSPARAAASWERARPGRPVRSFHSGRSHTSRG